MGKKGEKVMKMPNKIVSLSLVAMENYSSPRPGQKIKWPSRLQRLLVPLGGLVLMINRQKDPMCMKAMAHLFHTLQNFTLALVQEEHLTTVYFTAQLPGGMNLTLCIGLIMYVLLLTNTTQFVKTQLEPKPG